MPTTITTGPAELVDKQVLDYLDELIQLDFDEIRTYQQALEHVDDVQAHSDLLSFLGDHERHIMDLTRMIRGLGGTPHELHRDARGVLLEGMTKVRSMTGTKGALKAMRANEKLTAKTYERAAESDLPLIVRELIAMNLQDERRHLAMIEAHLDRLSGVAEPARDVLDEADTEAPELRPHTPL